MILPTMPIDPKTLVAVEKIGDKFELCLGVYRGDTREAHEDFYLTLRELTDLRDQIDEMIPRPK